MGQFCIAVLMNINLVKKEKVHQSLCSSMFYVFLGVFFFLANIEILPEISLFAYTLFFFYTYEKCSVFRNIRL